MRDRLEKVFDFDEADLLINQNGQLSEKQLRKISEIQRMFSLFGRIAFLVIFLSLAGVSLIALYNLGIDWQKNPAPVVAYALFFSGGMLLFIFFLLVGRLRSNLKSGKISVVEGFAEKKKKKMPRQLGTAYYVTLGRVKFQLDERAKYDALEPATQYRIFYIKHPPAHIILSLTEISDC